MILPAAASPLWLLFGEANLAAHLALAVMGIVSWLGAMGFGAAALGKRFRYYSLVTLAVVVAFNALALSYAPEVNAGEPTPFIGLYERIVSVPTTYGSRCLRWPCGVGGPGQFRSRLGPHARHSQRCDA